jgi:hypothetical protein
MTALLGDPTCRSDCFLEIPLQFFRFSKAHDGWIGFRLHCIETLQKKNFEACWFQSSRGPMVKPFETLLNDCNFWNH